jgi:flagellar protein FlaJ
MIKTDKELNLIKLLSIRYFGDLAEKYSKYFDSLRQPILEADLKILFRSYVSMIMFTTVIVYFSSFFIVLFYSLLFNLGNLLRDIVLYPAFAALATFLLTFFYPISRANRRKSDIEANLPFAINNMAAVAGSGVPPRTVFKVLSQFEEYGELARESRKIARNIEFFGLDEITAIKEVSLKTPSRNFRNLLEGITMTIQTGGDIIKFLKEQAEKSLFNYRIRREKYNENISVYADLYTALLIAAPLLFIAILSILSVLGGNVFGIATQDLIRIGIFFLIPGLNILFLVILQLSQPMM